MTYPEAVRWLYGTQLHGINLGLEGITHLLHGLQVPLASAAAPRFFHVAGTNGKGSVCAMLDSICRAAGYRTGLFISPHLVSFRERIKVDGEMIGENEAAAGLSEIRNLIAGWKNPPTFFEIVTALALTHFARSKVEIVVLETGLGGRLDATNVVTPMVSVITPIDLDHQQWLGHTPAEIAMEKAGIIKPAVPVISAPQTEEVLSVLTQIAAHREAPFNLVMTPIGEVPIGLRGAHQRWNAALAIHALSVSELPVPDEAIVRGLAEVQWPGRFQVVDEHLVLDGAHNPAAARQLVETWRETFGEERATLILGVLKDKDAAGICQTLAPIAARVFAVPVRSERSLAPQEVLPAFASLAAKLECTMYPNVARALAVAEAWPEKALVTGSLFLVGEVLEQMQGGGDGMPSAQ